MIWFCMNEYHWYLLIFLCLSLHFQQVLIHVSFSYFINCLVGLAHGDFNDRNIITSQKQLNISQDSPTKSCDQSELAGIIDFGEVAYTYIICDIAITLSELMRTNTQDGFKTGAELLSGYSSMQEIPEVERSSLYYLVMARDAQMIMLCLEAKMEDPMNDYIMESFTDSCNQLKKLVSMQKSDVESLWNI